MAPGAQECLFGGPTVLGSRFAFHLRIPPSFLPGCLEAGSFANVWAHVLAEHQYPVPMVFDSSDDRPVVHLPVCGVMW